MLQAYDEQSLRHSKVEYTKAHKYDSIVGILIFGKNRIRIVFHHGWYAGRWMELLPSKKVTMAVLVEGLVNHELVAVLSNTSWNAL